MRLKRDNIVYSPYKSFYVAIPPLEVQQEIVHLLDNFEAICTDLTAGLSTEITTRQKQYEYYRDKLLSFKAKE